MRTRLCALAFAACLAAAAMALPSPTWAVITRLPQTLHAAPEGSGTTCSLASPCAISTALAQSKDGDTIDLAGGTYTVSELAITTAITMQPEAGAEVVIEGGASFSYLLDVAADAPVTLAHLELEHSFGGGVKVSSGDLSVLADTIVNRATSQSTGDIGIDATNSVDPVTVTNTTIANEDYGIALGRESETITHATLVHNYIGIYGGITAPKVPYTIDLGGDMVLGSDEQDCALNASYMLVDDSGNLDGDGTCSLTPAAGSLPGRSGAIDDVALLADNGGQTKTAALLPGSPAIGLVHGKTLCTGADERGASRKADSCDAGAFETEPTPSVRVQLTVSPAGGASAGKAVSLSATVAVVPAGGVYPAPTGTVAVTADGATLTGCAAVPLSATGESCSATGLGAGTYDLRATYSGDAHYPPTSDTISNYPVSKVASALELAASPSAGVDVGDLLTLTATLSGPASGTVDFTANGNAIDGCTGVGLHGGVATCKTSGLDPGTYRLRATYAGDGTYRAARDQLYAYHVIMGPTITASVSSSVAKSSYGWYRKPVTVSFHCKDGTAALVGDGCPEPVTLSSSGRGQTITRSVTARDGGTAHVKVTGLNIDRLAPTVVVTGVKRGHTYRHVPHPTCKATDAMSGVAKCAVTKKKVHVKKHVTTWSYTATAIDKAGNRKTTTGTYKVK